MPDEHTSIRLKMDTAVAYKSEKEHFRFASVLLLQPKHPFPAVRVTR